MMVRSGPVVAMGRTTGRGGDVPGLFTGMDMGGRPGGCAAEGGTGWPRVFSLAGGRPGVRGGPWKDAAARCAAKRGAGDDRQRRARDSQHH